MSIIEFLLLFGAGIIGGFLSGLLSVGGAPIYMVIFTEFINRWYGTQISDEQSVHLVIANAIFARLLAVGVACFKHYQLNNFFLKTVLTIAIPSTIVSVLLTFLLSKVHYSKQVFSLVFILLLVPLLIQMLRENESKKQFNQPQQIKILFLFLLGILNGIITGLSGLGGGFILTPMLNSLYNIKIRKVISISMGVIFITSLALTICNLTIFNIPVKLPYTVGAICLPISIPVTIAGFIAAPFGVNLSIRLNPKQLRNIFVSICFLVIIYTIINLF